MIRLHDDRQFRLDKGPDAILKRQFDGKAWEAITCSHTWSRLDNYTQARADGAAVRQGTGWNWLRLRDFALPRGQCVALQSGQTNLIFECDDRSKIGPRSATEVGISIGANPRSEIGRICQHPIESLTG